VGLLRSGKLDECFNDSEEREFLAELAEAALHEAHETLASHQEDSRHVDTPAEIDEYVTTVQRQKRKIKFLELLHECLVGEVNN
jgi:hypothetical protein